jgi:hypothetical protein
MLVVGVVYAGAWLAATMAGGHIQGGLSELIPVLRRLAEHPGDPAAAWGSLAIGLPGPALYWACTVGIVTVTLAIIPTA